MISVLFCDVFMSDTLPDAFSWLVRPTFVIWLCRSTIFIFNSLFSLPDFCGGTYRGTEGVVTSPNYPSGYAADLDCSWILEVPTTHFIKLKIILNTDGRTNATGSCSRNFFDVFDDAASEKNSSCRIGFHRKKNITLALNANKGYIHYRYLLIQYTLLFRFNDGWNLPILWEIGEKW